MNQRGRADKSVLLTFLVAVALAVLVATGVLKCGGEPPAGLPALEDFVKAVHVHGVPYEIASRYDASQIDVLLDWLENPTWSPHHANIAIVIGMIGPQTDAQVQRLTQFIAKPSPGPLSPVEYQAKQAAVMSLGYAAHAMRSSDRAVRYLIASALPSAWADGRAAWQTPYGEGPAVIQRHFARLSIIAMGLSGRSEALARLQELRDDPVGPPEDRDESFRTDNLDILLEAIATNTRVQKHKLDGYYADD